MTSRAGAAGGALLLVLAGCAEDPTEESCAAGCVELGVLVDEEAPDADDVVRVREAQRAFWTAVNDQGGIGGRDVVLRPVGTSDALAYLATSQVSPPPVEELPADAFVAGALPPSSRWLFEDGVLQTGGSVCIQAMNGVDALAYRGASVGSVAAVHLVDELGRDTAAGASLAAERRGVPFTALDAAPGADIGQLASEVFDLAPEVLVLGVSPAETGVVVAEAVDQGFGGEIVTTSPGWDRSLNDGRYADAVAGRLVVADSWREFTLPTLGHSAMREALGDVEPDDAYTAGWIGNYPMLDLLRAAAASGDLTRPGLVAAARTLDDVDHDGMVPPLLGTPFSGDPTEQAALRTVFEVPDAGAPAGTRSIEDYFNGLTAASHEFDRPCFEER